MDTLQWFSEVRSSERRIATLSCNRLYTFSILLALFNIAQESFGTMRTRKSPAGIEVGVASRQGQAYAELRRRILEGELQPEAPLSEYQLAAQLRLSRTPVREALKRLEHEGLVRFVHNRGAFVAELSVRDIVEIYQVREQLEGFAARIAAQEMPSAEVGALEQELDRAQKFAAEGKTNATFESDVHLHKQIIQCTKNKRLVTFLAALEDQVHRVRVLSSKAPGRLKATLNEHREILDQIKRRDGAGAQQAMVQHLRAACENAVRLMMPGGRIGPEDGLGAVRAQEMPPSQ
jgi:GntR family transcriptional regulator, rspAB operon transcriptional repressor